MRVLRNGLALVLGLALGGVAVSAFAAVSDYGRSMRLNAPPSSGARFTGAPIYDWADAPSGWGNMKDINKINIGGKAFDVTGGRLFSPQTLAKGAVSFVRYGGPAWIGFMVAGLVWDEVTQRWLKDEENTQEWPSHRWGVQGCNGPSCEPNFATYQDAGHFACTQYYGTQGVSVWTPGGGDPPTMYYNCAPGGAASHPFRVCPDGQTLQGDICVDVEVGSRPATDQELEDAILAELVARANGSDLARRLIEAGYKPAVDGIEINGPSSIPGGSTTTTTTGPAGQTTTTTNTTHNVTYNTNTTNNTSTVTVTTTNNSTTVAPDGTTTETTIESPAEDGETPPPEEPTPFCEQFPDASACQPLGETPDQELEAEARNVGLLDYQTVTGTCPAPMTFSVSGHSQEISYQYICDGAVAMRPLLIALGMLSAGIFVFSAVGKQS